jgi:dienelactone hydrolase
MTYSSLDELLRKAALPMSAEIERLAPRDKLEGSRNMGTLKAVFLGLALTISLSAPASFAEQNQLERMLSQPILDPVQTLNEVEVYAGSRVRSVPVFSSPEEWMHYTATTRASVIREIMLRGEAEKWATAPCKVEWLGAIAGGPGYHIRKLRFEAVPGFWIPALLYEPDELVGKVPVVLEVNGHDSGKAQDNKQIRCINEARRGMIALNPDWIGTGQLANNSHVQLNQLDLGGTSGVGVFYLSLKKSLDILLSLEHADPNRVAVTGYSGGGWQTITISSLDTRVKLAAPVAGYSSFMTKVQFPAQNLGDPEQQPADLGTIVDYTGLTVLLPPRPTLLIYNAKENCCFRADNTLPVLLQAATPIFRLLGEEENLQYHINYNPGTHNYARDNREAFYRFLGQFFYPHREDYPQEEFPLEEGEIKTSEELHVDLPATNESLHTLALKLSRDLPDNPGLPTERASAEQWQQSARTKLREIIRARDYNVDARPGLSCKELGGLQVTLLQLRMGGVWTVPAVMMRQAGAERTTILVSDEGRKSIASEAEKLLHEGQNVLAVDPLYFGESKIVPETQATGAKQDIYFALLLTSLGDRILGLDASQLMAAARWLRDEEHTGPVGIEAWGPQTSLAALVAADLEHQAIGSLVVHDLNSSLKDIIEQNLTIQKAPVAFCFGLLKSFDIPQLIALMAPRPLSVIKPAAQLKVELVALRNYYAAMGLHLEFGPSESTVR